MATLVLDIEIYKDYFLLCLMDVNDPSKRFSFEWYEGRTLLRQNISDVLKRNTIITFNGNGFDMPLIGLALEKDSTIQKVKAAADSIIVEGQAPWQLGLNAPKGVDHIDLIEVAPGMASLKMYGGRMHCKKLQDLPIDPGASISPDQRQKLVEYCYNDLELTAMLYKKLKPQIALRETMSDEYGIDLRSKSDAQIAEAVIKSKVQDATGKTLSKPRLPPGYTFKYVPPEFIQYQTSDLKQTLEMVRSVEFVVDGSGSPKCKALESHTVKIGGSTYRLGVGGLHSSESKAAHVADDEYVLIDRDVASYYPAIILNCELYPKHIGPEFLDVYREIVNRRLAAKKAKDTVTADSLKITINGSFGKFGSKYSVLYSPDLLIQTTVTGQLSLLMLIEALELSGIQVVSANTDGIVIKCHKSKLDLLEAEVKLWEFFTGFDTEDTHYDALYSRDVNNYLAIKVGGGVKTKGAYAGTSLMKSPVFEICNDAVKAYLSAGVPVEQTILQCRDITKFVTIRQVKGGAEYKGEKIGKCIRWYYGKGAMGAIHYVSNGNRVATSEGAVPLMQLPDELPTDIDYCRYVAMSQDILRSVGANFF